MGPIQAIKTCLRKYATFSGRASRSEFWWFILADALLFVVASYVDQWVFGVDIFNDFDSVLPFSTSAEVATLLPWLAVVSRRFHDAGLSSKWCISLLIFAFVVVYGEMIAILLGMADVYLETTAYSIVYFICAVIYLIPLVVGLRPSTPGFNAYGQDPSEPDVEIFA